jgi:predicted transcriptional regulator
MTVRELCNALQLNVVALPDGDRTVEGAYVGDLLSWVMGRAESGNVWITIMSNINVIAVASLADVACVLLAEGVTVDDTIRQTAEEKGINLLSSSKTAYRLAGELIALGI